MELVTNIFANLLLIKPYGANTIAFGPKMAAPITSFELMVKVEYLYGTFPF